MDKKLTRIVAGCLLGVSVLGTGCAEISRGTRRYEEVAELQGGYKVIKIYEEEFEATRAPTVKQTLNATLGYVAISAASLGILPVCDLYKLVTLKPKETLFATMAREEVDRKVLSTEEVGTRIEKRGKSLDDENGEFNWNN